MYQWFRCLSVSISIINTLTYWIAASMPIFPLKQWDISFLFPCLIPNSDETAELIELKFIVTKPTKPLVLNISIFQDRIPLESILHHSWFKNTIPPTIGGNFSTTGDYTKPSFIPPNAVAPSVSGDSTTSTGGGYRIRIPQPPTSLSSLDPELQGSVWSDVSTPQRRIYPLNFMLIHSFLRRRIIVLLKRISVLIFTFEYEHNKVKFLYKSKLRWNSIFGEKYKLK